ncbi:MULTISPECIES: hypothetical protein [unclassified Arthrobacter]|jgi:hypothetical protein|uniref:hypothetical protein n=1 Tax=unclassified Arthrobacter TaxID=235627 RepID=UPI001F47D0E2|nr:hypothetical protein [Arthrobacter sp. FW305-BF8]UKA53248.1 hypothetical protein LFT45_16140 [Arthrobacter sp. FW305-BF8]
MHSNPERSARDEEVWEWHKQALAAGQHRVISRTMSGELYSYAKDEIGFRRNGPGYGVSTLWGLSVVTIVMAVVGVFMIVVATGALSPDGKPAWGFLVLSVFAAGMVWWGVHCAMSEFKARKIREQRGVPTPSSAPL